MMARSRRGFQSSAANPERVRTHLLFSSHTEHNTAKRKRRAQNRFYQTMHKKDEMIQANPDDLDPKAWTGNQRILHFGPMAQRDPFFYYYPKGWDILYPAQFGFFPYRTSKFRGNSTAACVWAFGVFLILGGALMTYLGFFVVYNSPFWTWKKQSNTSIPPVQIIGPVMLGVGVLLAVLGLICAISTSQFFNDKIRHYYHRGQPASVMIYTTHFEEPCAVYEKNPYQPLPPPALPVVKNNYAQSSNWNTHGELKLYPPVLPGYSTLSLHTSNRKSPSVFVASPYNTLRAMSTNRFPTSAEPLQTPCYENTGSISMSGGGSRRPSASSATPANRRARSVGTMQRESSFNNVRHYRESSQNN